MMMRKVQRVLSALMGVVLLASTALAAEAKPGSFAEFDRRAGAGEHLNVVFFGASLTWGANDNRHRAVYYGAVLPPLTQP